MRKNKILSLLVVFIMICTLIPCISSAEDVNEPTSSQLMKYNTIVGLGIMSTDQDGNFLSETAVTRGELAKIISSMFNTGSDAVVEWKEKFFKELDEEFETADTFSEGIELYTDVDDSSDYYNAIKTVSDLGIMTGYTDGSFGPESQLTYEQAYKVLVSMLGYRARAMVYGGFPNGFVRMASELKLLDGLTNTTGTINNGDMAILIYNALDVKMLDIVSMGKNIEYSAENSETFLKRFLGMQKITGRVTDNGYSNLIGDQVVTHDFMVIGNVKVRMTPETQYARNYFGRTVNAYVTDNNNGEYTLVYAATDDLDKVLTINVNDFVSYQNGTITYKVNEDNKKSVNIPTNVYMIYNGSGTPSYTADTFNFSSGTISVVTSKGAGKADMLIVEAYESYYVDYVDYINKLVYSKKVVNNEYAADEINLDRDDDYCLIIKNDKGTSEDISGISSDSVISVAEGKNSMTVVTSSKKIQDFAVNEISTVSGITYVSNGEKRYPLSGKVNVNDLVVGEKYTIYIDIFGEAVYFKAASANAAKFTTAIVISSMQTTGLDPLTAIKVIKDDGSVEDYDIAKKITVSGNPDLTLSVNDEKKMEPAEFYNFIKDYHRIVRYTLNSEGEIDYIEFPVKQTTFGNPDNRLTEIYLPDTAGKTADDNIRDLFFESGEVKGWQYMQNQGFSGRVLVDRTNTKVFVCPKNAEDAGDEDNYNVSGVADNFSEGKYNVKAYTTVADSKVAQHIINLKNAKRTTITFNTRTFHVFDRSYMGVDEDGMACKFISFYTGSKANTLALSDECVDNSGNIKVVSIMNDANGVAYESTVPIEKGDIFRYALDKEGKIETVQLIVDENAQNPAASNPDNFVGNLYGTAGKWDKNAYSEGKTNPYVVYNDTNGKNIFTASGNWWSDHYMGYMRNALFWPVYTRGTNELCLTTQPLGVDGEKYVLDELGETFVTDSFVISTINAITIGANGVTVKSIPINQLKTYEYTTNDCDRIFVSTRVGVPQSYYAYVNYSDDLEN